MRIVDALKDRETQRRLLDPADPRFVTGSEEDRKRARAEWRRQCFVAAVMNAKLVEIPRGDLAFGRFGILENTRTGDLYRARRGEIEDLDYSPAVAYYVGADGLPVLLERPAGPKTVAEREQLRAEQERRRTAPRPKPAWMTRAK